jgi:glucose-6-phosphate isomerase
MMTKAPFMPFATEFNLTEGIMQEPDTRIRRMTSEMRGYYADDDALEELIRKGDPIHYEVFEKDIPEAYGHLRVCISKVFPGTVGDEFFMTKGHYHTVVETAELYFTLRGEGYMLMKTSAGQSVAERMVPGRMVYVPPCWAHRSINTGDEALISLCVYPGEAGHNYGDIEKEGFPQRINSRNGKIEIVNRGKKSS